MNNPIVSVVIPCRPDVKSPSVLNSLNSVDYPRDRLEIIVEKGNNPPAQRNRGIKKARGEIIAFIDDDCVIEEDWLKNAIKYFEDKEVMIVGGPNLTPKSDSFLSHCFGHAMSSYFGTATMSHRYRSAGSSREASEQELILANMLCRREVFDGGMYFNERLFPNEENELINRVEKEGYKIMYAPDVQVYHPRKKSFFEFSKQFLRYGYGRAMQSRIQKESFKMLYLLPTLFTFGLLLLPLSLILQFQTLSFLLLLGVGVYFLIALYMASAKSIENKDIRIFFLLPILFPILHIFYGIGFVLGLLKPLEGFG